MDPEAIAKALFKIATLIYSRVQLAKANKNQCIRLAQRIKQVMDSVAGLETLPNNDRFVASLNALLQILNECHALIDQFTGESWFKRVIKARSSKAQFASLTQELLDILPQLNVGLTAHMLVKREDDVADERADMEELRAKQDEILALNERVLVEVQALRLDRGDLEAIVAKQLQSIKFQFATI